MYRALVTIYCRNLMQVISGGGFEFGNHDAAERLEPLWRLPGIFERLPPNILRRTRLEEHQRSDVQLYERLASLGIMGRPIESPHETPGQYITAKVLSRGPLKVRLAIFAKKI